MVSPAADHNEEVQFTKMISFSLFISSPSLFKKKNKRNRERSNDFNHCGNFRKLAQSDRTKQ